MLHVYPDLLRYARRVSKRPDEAEDILQSVLLAAVIHGRADLEDERNRRWLMAAIRKQTLFVARCAARRRKREAPLAGGDRGHAEDTDFARLCARLPPALATTARLIGTGHSKQELLWLLRISDAALRQRIVEIRRRLGAARLSADNILGQPGPLQFGLIRRHLLPPVRRDGAFLASHDPDGHVFILGATSQIARARQHGSATAEE